ncbi:septum site-determining protein MinC [Litchfieldia salsa]|uniref:Probable septum site-determining protein MinC n=1 Tax=Litchfieldia salsa TaxID=930152 RepID=A0A1H0NTJ2_9BACI|nr:septum site-determining protein MinC [Litchfieldia salsa]
MKGQKQQLVTIKGTKDGLTLHLDDQCSFRELVGELTDKLALNHSHGEDSPLLAVRLKVGNRYLTKIQEEELRTIIRSKKHLIVDSIESNVISKKEAKEIKQKNEIVSVTKIVRSGQVLKVDGDLLLIGDVNPGGTVIAEGNIFVLGSLRGIAHAGFHGNNEAVIAASLMKPSQLRISNIMNRAPDNHKEDEQNEMECAYVDENETIVIDRLQQLMHLRPNLTRLEGGI